MIKRASGEAAKSVPLWGIAMLHDQIISPTRLAKYVLDAQNNLLRHKLALCAWSQKSPDARMILGAKREIVWANDAAELFFPTQDALSVKDAKLCVAHNSNAQKFEKAMTESPSLQARFACLDCEDGRRHVLMCVENIVVDNISYMALTVRLAAPLDCSPARLATLLTPAFRLTEMECRLVSCLFQGLTAEETAKLMKVSIETTRSHIRNLYGKLSVSSREAMFARLLPYVTFG
jgi:DNA-binding CsgD family transcriptional regulator